MKIAQFINTTDPGGAETLVLSLTEQIIKLNYDVEVHAFANSWIAQRCAELHLPCYTIDKNLEQVYPVRMLPLWGKRYGQVLKQRGVDILHSHLYGATVRGAAATCWNNIVHVATQHDTYSIDEKTKSRVRWLNLSGMLGSQLVMISNQMVNYYVNRGVNLKYCCFIYNGVDNNRFKSDFLSYNLRYDLGVKDDEVLFVAPGRLENIKGFDVLIKAFQKVNLWNTDARFRLLILGDGSERGNLEHMVNTFGLTDKVQFLGIVNNVENYLAAADVFVLGSRNEGLPCSIIEAMFTGLPIIATDVGGNCELVHESQNGYLVPSENTEALALKIQSMIQCGDSERRAMGAKSFEHAQNFTLETMAQKYVSLYNGVCL